jgi:hypothetical protein
MLKAWHEHDDIDFEFINSHDKVSGVRDTSLKQTLRRSLLKRLANSKNMVLIIGNTTKNDTDWVPFEIEQAVDNYGLPIIAVYTGAGYISNPSKLAHLWPRALATRIASSSVRAIHIPFKQALIDKAIRQYDISHMPGWANTVFKPEIYRSAGIDVGQ